MQSTMNVNGLQRQGSQENCNVDNSLRKKCSLWYRRSMRGSDGRHQQSTLPKVHKPKQTHLSSLVDYSDPQRTTIKLEKQDNETFGFELQTYGLQLRNSCAVEMCTFVCRVEEDSAAENAGLTTGDVIVTINGTSIEGFSHQRVLDLIRESANSLKMETVCGSVVKWIELEKKMNLLEQSLSKKMMELQALTLQELRLTRGQMNSSSSLPLSLDSSEILSALKGRRGRRFSSDSSYRSVMTDDSDQASVFGSPSPCSAASSTEDGYFFSRELPLPGNSSRSFSSSTTNHHQSIGRLSSSSFAACSSSGSSSPSPMWDEKRTTSLFGTLPRKSRRTGVRKNILRLLPGLQRSVEEEDIGSNT